MIKLKQSEEGKLFGKSIFESISVGAAHELLRHDLVMHLAELQREMHFRYCRFHGIFNRRMAVAQRRSDGSLGYQWHHVDKITDNLLSVGLKPFFELNDMPDEMASGSSLMFKWQMNTSEPKDYDEWGDLVEAFVRHMVERYGLEEVKTWYFEVWNEPNLEGFWPAGMDAYYKLYTYTAKAVKKVDADLRVGGPASAGGNYVTELIDYCCDHDVALDFISTHAYPIGEYCEYKERKGSPYELGEYFVGRFREVKEAVLASRRPELEIHWTEWNTQSGNSSENISWICNPTVDQHFGGACVVKNMLGVRDICDSVAYWVVSDIFGEAGIPHSVFSCTYGLMNIHGIKKASYNAYKLLNKMRGTEMKPEPQEKYPLGCGIAATEEKGIVRVIAYNQQLLEIQNQPDWTETVEIPMAEGEYILTSAKIRKGQGSCYETWLEMGMPQNLSPMQEEMLRAKSEMEYDFQSLQTENGVLKVPFQLKADEVIYLEIQKKDIPAMPRNTSASLMRQWDNAMMLHER